MEKTIKITEETHALLLEEGKKGETFDALFRRLLKKGDKNVKRLDD